MYTSIIKKSTIFVRSILENELDDTFEYHNLEHTLYVTEQVLALAEYENLGEEYPDVLG